MQVAVGAMANYAAIWEGGGCGGGMPSGETEMANQHPYEPQKLCDIGN